MFPAHDEVGTEIAARPRRELDLDVREIVVNQGLEYMRRLVIEDSKGYRDRTGIGQTI